MRYIFVSNHELEVHRAGSWEGEMDVKRERARTSWNPWRLTGIQVSSLCFQPWWCGILQKLAPCTKELNTHLAQEKERWSRTQGTRGQSQSWLLPDKEVGRQTEWYTRAGAHLASTGTDMTASSLLRSKSHTKMSLLAHPTQKRAEKGILGSVVQPSRRIAEPPWVCWRKAEHNLWGSGLSWHAAWEAASSPSFL